MPSGNDANNDHHKPWANRIDLFDVDFYIHATLFRTRKRKTNERMIKSSDQEYIIVYVDVSIFISQV